MYLQVFLGGGRRNFIPDNQTDPEYPLQTGDRTDGRDLIQEWRDIMANEKNLTEGTDFAYVDNLGDFQDVDTSTVQHLFGMKHFLTRISLMTALFTACFRDIRAESHAVRT